MSRASELTVEEKAALAFLEYYFERQGMRSALAMIRNVDTDIDNLRTIIDGYRHLYLSERR